MHANAGEGNQMSDGMELGKVTETEPDGKTTPSDVKFDLITPNQPSHHGTTQAERTCKEH